MIQKIKKYFLDYIAVHKRRIILVGIFFLLSIALILITQNDYSLYQQPIGKVVGIEEKKAYEEEGVYGEKEEYVRQILTIIFLSGEKKGTQDTYENVYGESGVSTTRYQIGDELLLQVDTVAGEQELTIVSLKRDTYIVFLLCLFFAGLLFLAGKQGALTIAAMVSNIAIYTASLFLFTKGISMVILCIVMILIFSAFTLLVIGGFQKKIISAIIATVITTGILWILFLLLSMITKDIPYEMLDMGTMNIDKLPMVYLAGVFIGCLGAVMDVSITVNSSVNEILITSPKITKKELLHSVSEISHDIMGTMINVLLFTYLCGGIPLLILKMKTRFTLSHIYTYDLQFELIRFLLGALGIVLAIPVSATVAVYFSGKKVE